MPNKPLIRKTVTLDASGKVLGRLATEIARLLQGKHKASYLPNVDAGDFVRVTNAAKIRLTGRKEEQKVYHHYSGYPGGLKTRSAAEYRKTDPGKIIRLAVDRMLPKNTFRPRRLKRLEIVK